MLCTMYHRIESSNLLQIDRIWSRNFATCRSAVDDAADSAELEQKKFIIIKMIKKIIIIIIMG